VVKEKILQPMIKKKHEERTRDQEEKEEISKE